MVDVPFRSFTPPIVFYLNKKKLGDVTNNNIVDIVAVVATLTARGRKQNYQRGRLSIIAWYLQAESLSDLFFALSNNT